MTEADLEAIRAGVAAARYRLAIFETASAGTVTARRPRAVRAPCRAHGVNALASAFGLRLLRAVPNYGGTKAQAIEVERLCALAAAGVRVPEVLHVDAGFTVIPHLEGPSLVRAIERGAGAGFTARQSGLAALVDVHARGGYLSQAFARNFIVTRSGLARIDFEDDPLEDMSLEEAPARDWLAYLHSTAWLLDREADEIHAAFASCIADERPAVRDELVTAGRRPAPLRHLPRSRRPWGREVVGTRAVARLFAAASMAPAKMRA